MSSFGPVAPYYDLLMASVPYRMWLSYWELLLIHQGIEPKSVLDVCCGTGTLTELVAAKVPNVAGIDLSAPMIERAKHKAADKGLPIRYEAADAAEFELHEAFEAAYSFFDSLNYLTTEEHLRRALHRVAAHVKPGGSWIFDLNTAYAFEQQMFDQKDLRAKAKLRYEWKGEYDPASRLIHVHMKFWTLDGQEFTETHVQRAHPLDDVVGMLEEAGFEKIRAFNSYSLDPVRANSDRVHLTAIRSV